MPWTLTGETGKTFDASSDRTLEALGITAARLSFRTLAADTLTWSAVTTSAAGAGTIIPNEGQSVTLKLDGARKFTGHVTKVSVRLRSVEVEAAGPWWWLERTPVIDGTSSRASIGFAEQDVATSVTALLNRAIALDCPLRVGTIAAAWSIPKMTVSLTSCADALAELLRWVPDAVGWFDHTDTSGNGYPKFNVTRRGAAAAKGFTVGTDVVDLDISPVFQLEIGRVEVHSMTRDATGAAVAATPQTDGTAARGKRQIITVSGPELDTYLPEETLDSHQIQSSVVDTDPNKAGYGGSVGSTYYVTPYYGKRLIDLEPRFAGAREQLGSLAVPANCRLAVGNNNSIVWRSSSGGSNQAHWLPYLRHQNADTGVTQSTAGWHIVLTGEPPDWVREELGRWFVRTRISGQIYFLLARNSVAAPAWMGLVGAPDRSESQAFDGNGDGLGWYAWNFEIEAWMVNYHYSALTTVYRPADWNFVAPPANLASNLKAAQAWLPWSGRIDTLPATVDGENLLNRKFNVAGAATAAASMDALARSVEWDIASGRLAVELGAPARHDYKSLVSRLRRTPQDNIVWL